MGFISTNQNNKEGVKKGNCGNEIKRSKTWLAGVICACHSDVREIAQQHKEQERVGDSKLLLNNSEA